MKVSDMLIFLSVVAITHLERKREKNPDIFIHGSQRTSRQMPSVTLYTMVLGSSIHPPWQTERLHRDDLLEA